MAEVKNTTTWRDGKNNILRGLLRDPNYYSEVIDNVGKKFDQHIFNIYAEITAPNKKTGECDIVVLNIEVIDGHPDEENLSKLLELLATPGAELTKMEFDQFFDGSINWYSAELGEELAGDITLKTSATFNDDGSFLSNDLFITFNDINDPNYASLWLRDNLEYDQEERKMDGYRCTRFLTCREKEFQEPECKR